MSTSRTPVGLEQQHPPDQGQQLSDEKEQQQAKRWSRAADEKLRKQFLHEVREKCRPQLEAFTKCAKEGSLFFLRFLFDNGNAALKELGFSTREG